MSTLKPHVLSWLREGFQELSNANIMDGWARGGYLACWQPELQEEARRRVLAGELNLFDVSPEDEEEPVQLAIGDEDEENVVDAGEAVAAPPALVDAGNAVAAPPAIPNEGTGAGAGAGADARHLQAPECSTELKTVLHTLGYEQYSAVLARAGVCGMAELTATSKTELQRMGVLPGHANLLLQRARKPSDAQRAPKQPKATRALAPFMLCVHYRKVDKHA